MALDAHRIFACGLMLIFGVSLRFLLRFGRLDLMMELLVACTSKLVVVKSDYLQFDHLVHAGHKYMYILIMNVIFLKW